MNSKTIFLAYSLLYNCALCRAGYWMNALATEQVCILIFAEEMWKLRWLCISLQHRMPKNAEDSVLEKGFLQELVVRQYVANQVWKLGSGSV